MTDSIVRPLCIDTIPGGCGKKTPVDWPHCIDDGARCRAEARCYWRMYHQLEEPQGELRLEVPGE